MSSSLSNLLAEASPEQVRDAVAALPAKAAAALRYDWAGLWARENQQIPPPREDVDWLVWLILAGRGFGKTRTGAETVREWARNPNARIALVARTAADVRDVMVEGESGILAVHPPWERPHYEPSKRQITWPNGAIAKTYSADKPDLLRGPQQTHAWCDELASYRYLEETWSNLMLGLRLGRSPRCVVTTTPRPRKMLRDLIKDETTVVTRGSTYDNLGNLAPPFRRQVLSKYEGTTLGRQELYAELLDEAPGALWKRTRIDELRVEKAPELVRVVVGVDPAATSSDDSDETGIVVKGLGRDGHLYTLADYSGRYSPNEWATAVCRALADWKADRIVAESNNGGEMVESTIRVVAPNAPITLVHASRGKLTRAEPVAAMHEQGREHHVGSFPQLEDQKCNWVPGMDASPDRMDADVWASTELLAGTVDVVGVGPGEKSEGLDEE